jgi:hypothetical protein
MKKVLYLVSVLMVAVLVMSSSCKKSSGGGGSNETPLSVDLNPAAGSNQAPSPGPDFPLTVTIKSTMPPSGVKIDVSAKQDGSTSTFFTTSVNTSTATNNFTITGSPRSVTLRVDVTVTSITDASNKWTGGYTYSRK